MWRIDERLIRNSQQLSDLNKYLESNYLRIQNVFTFYRAWGGNLGYIETETMRLIAKETQIAIESNRRSKGQLLLEDVTRFMIAAKFVDNSRVFEKDKQPVSTDRSLMRYQFAELLVRCV